MDETYPLLHNKKFLKDKISDTINNSINNADRTISNKRQKINISIRKYVILLFVIIILVGISEFIILYFMLDLVYTPYDVIYKEKMILLNQTTDKYNHVHAKINDHYNLLMKYIGDLYYDIIDKCPDYYYQYEEQDSIINFDPCYILRNEGSLMKDYGDIVCFNLFTKTCNTVNNNNISIWSYSEANVWETSEWNLYNQIQTINNDIKNGFHGERLSVKYLMIFICVNLIILFIIVLIVIITYRKSKSIKNLISSLGRVDECISSPYVASNIINISDKLGIQYDTTIEIDQLINNLQHHNDVLEMRMAKRIAFLGGYLRPGATSYQFLSNPASKDVKRMIMKMAGL